MSMESAKAYIERMKNDEDFARKVTEFKDSDERMRYVKKAGFDFTKEEIDLVKAELSDEELEDIAGGGKGAKPRCCILDFWGEFVLT